MKPVVSALLSLGLFALAGCTSPKPVVMTEPTVVEAACGECKFGLKGDGCDLAVRIGGRAYFVKGVDMDSLGDAHAAHGLCNAIRKARVTGEVKDGRLVATRFELLPPDSGR
jgi:hypothetical protein